MTLRYAGIGPRITPQDKLRVMTDAAIQLDQGGWHLVSGWGRGADQAFGLGAKIRNQTQWVPWNGFNGATTHDPFKIMEVNPEVERIAKHHHRGWAKLNDIHRLLLMRNVCILLGNQVDQTVMFILYWQSAAKEKSYHGGTNHSLRIASSWGIPSFNIRDKEDREAASTFVVEAENVQCAS